MDELLSRLRLATAAELETLEELFDIKASNERELRLAALHGRYLAAAQKSTFRDALVAVVPLAASRAGWSAPKLSDTVEVGWIEEYLHQAVCFAYLKEKMSPSKKESAEARERAEAALQGKIEPPDKVMENAMWIAGGLAVAALLWWAGLSAALIVTSLRGFSLLFQGPTSQALVPATMVLIHVRKRTEFTTVLDSEPAEEVA